MRCQKATSRQNRSGKPAHFVRGRQKFCEQGGREPNQFHGLLSEHGITEDIKPLSVSERESLRDLSLPTPWGTLLSSYLEMIETLTDEIERIEVAIEDRSGSLKETQLPMTIPSVSYYSALMIHAEVGEIERFDRDKEVVSYAGLNPVIRESPDSRIEGGILKRGLRQLRWILVQCARTAVHTCEDEYLSRFYDRLAGKKGSQKAIVATVRKLLV